MSEFFLKLDNKLENDGYILTKILGKGSNGVAYDIGSNRVLKVTTDISEAKASVSLIGKNFKNVVNIYRVWMYKSIPDYFMIEQEKLDKFDLSGVDGRVEDFLKDKRRFAEDDKSFMYLRRFGHRLFDEQEQKNYIYLVDEFIPKWKKFFEDMLSAQKQLKSVSIEWGDFHFGNVMKSGPNYKIFDLGVSKSNGKIKDIREVRKENNRRSRMKKSELKRVIQEMLNEGFDYGVILDSLKGIEQKLAKIDDPDTRSSAFNARKQFNQKISECIKLAEVLYKSN